MMKTSFITETTMTEWWEQKQEYENIQLIIIDADSGEETIKTLKKYEDQKDIRVS